MACECEFARAFASEFRSELAATAAHSAFADFNSGTPEANHGRAKGRRRRPETHSRTCALTHPLKPFYFATPIRRSSSSTRVRLTLSLTPFFRRTA